LNIPFFRKESFTKEKKKVIFLAKVFAKQKSLFGIDGIYDLEFGFYTTRY
jgi:hypothetical protein